MINQKESKQLRIYLDSWLLQPLLQNMKTTKNKDQPTNNHKNRKLKNKRKIKAVGNITPTIDHYTRNGWMGDTHP